MWILFALTSATILASRKIQEKQLVGSAWGALWWMIRLGSAAAATTLWCIFSRQTSSMGNTTVWLILGVISLLIYPLYTFGYYYAVRHLPLSYFWVLGVVAPIANTVFAYLIFDTPPTLAGYIGIASILMGMTILLWKHENQSIPMDALIVAIFVYISMGFTPILDRIAMTHADPFTYAMLNQLCAVIPIFLMTFLLSGGPQIRFYKKNFIIITLIGLTQGVWWILSQWAFRTSPNVGYAVALINTHTIITSIYGVAILQEGITTKKLIVFIFMLVALLSFVFA